MKYWEAIKAMQEGKKVRVPKEFALAKEKWIAFSAENGFYTSDLRTAASVQTLLRDTEEDYMQCDRWEIFKEPTPVLTQEEKEFLLKRLPEQTYFVVFSKDPVNGFGRTDWTIAIRIFAKFDGFDEHRLLLHEQDPKFDGVELDKPYTPKELGL